MPKGQIWRGTKMRVSFRLRKLDGFLFFHIIFCHFSRRLGVIGAGLMGAGIANVSIDKGIDTVGFTFF
jgi:hypothetical protein